MKIKSWFWNASNADFHVFQNNGFRPVLGVVCTYTQAQSVKISATVAKIPMPLSVSPPPALWQVSEDTDLGEVQWQIATDIWV